MKVSGKGTVAGNISGEDMNIRGKAIIDGNCEVDTFTSEGQFIVGGLLSADEIQIDIHGECKAKEIGGQTINIRYKKSGLNWLFKTMFSPCLEAELIEGDNINIEHTITHTIRGNNVTIGPECEISVVEYHESYKNEGQSLVKEYKQI